MGHLRRAALPDGADTDARDAGLRDLDLTWIHAYDHRQLTNGTPV